MAKELTITIKFKAWPKWIYLPIAAFCFAMGMQLRIWMLGRMEVI